ncbi:hypothetical protein C9374_004015 [Naegleria lovaniensis]|uniref:Strictosidine synthase conserved region domain-containing protein n=1 Tax=Naegleria lovaniensis TaxID=51637 RepID=A0AA88KSN0_NAELO|nr:uncharacterized protein C9374_004015 [Naegleria lovaniensis]KAG2394251.1 hypothetical protein C9374_004015 [Naegleria lovaniensis]
MKSIYATLVSLLILAVVMVSATRIREKTIINSRKIGLGVLTGPESFAWDPVDQDILYTGIADGSIRRVNVTSGESTVFAYSVPSLNATTRATCGLSVLNEPICGRVLGLAFDPNDRNLIVADAYKGILRISFNNPSQVQVLVNSYQGVPFKMVNSIVLMPDGKTIYFTDSSLAYTRMQFVSIVLANSADSRLFKFNVETGELQLVISDLRFGNGIALSSDHSFLVINECSERRIRKYYLTGRKAGTNVVFEDIGGYPDNIKTDEDGNFLVGLYAETNADVTAIQSSTKIKNIFLQYVPPLTTLNMIPVMGLVKKLDRHGRVISVYVDRTATFVSRVSEADVHEGKMYLGSVMLPWLTVVDMSTDLQLN